MAGLSCKMMHDTGKIINSPTENLTPKDCRQNWLGNPILPTPVVDPEWAFFDNHTAFM